MSNNHRDEIANVVVFLFEIWKVKWLFKKLIFTQIHDFRSFSITQDYSDIENNSSTNTSQFDLNIFGPFEIFHKRRWNNTAQWQMNNLVVT